MIIEKIGKMNSFILFMICVLQIQWINCNSPAAELGIAPCIYSGNFDPSGTICAKEPMPIKDLPQECTSLIYDGIVFDTHFNINLTDEFKKIVPELIATGKPVYLYVGYTSQKFWIKPMKYVTTAVAQITTIQNELTKLGESNKIAGIVLTGLNYDTNTIHQFDDVFWPSLKKYVTDIKTNNSLQVGFYVNATTLMYYVANKDKLGFFIFDDWNDLIDYYIVGFYKFNPCNDEFKNGIVPLESNKPEVKSLKTFADAFSQSTISKTKFYLEFSSSPTPNDAATYQPICSITYQKYCESDTSPTPMCADNADTFFEKGKFAKEQKAKGIVIKYIDTIDPAGKCNCDNQNKFITFIMMLRGFKSEEPIKNCDKLNKK